MRGLRGIAAGVLAAALLGAVAATASAGGGPPGGGHDPVTVCHKPGTPAQHEITFDDDGYLPHLAHGDTRGPCEELPPPPYDECENLPGNQPEGTDCYPETPPVDVCENLPGNQPEGTDCTPDPPVVVTPPVDRCPPGMEPTGGKDGDESEPNHNQECRYPPTSSTPPSTPPATVPPAVVVPSTPPVVVTPPSNPGVVAKPPSRKPTAKPKPKPVAKTKPKAKPVPKPDAPHVCRTIRYTDTNGKLWLTPRTWVDGRGCVAKIQGSG